MLRVSEGWLLEVPRGMVVAEGAQMRAFLEATGNRLKGREVAVAGPEDLRWFVIISAQPAARPGPRRAEWVEHTQEEDGRRVAIRTVAVAAGDALVTFELVSEEREEGTAAAEFEALPGRLHTESTGMEWWRAVPAGGVALAGLWALVWLRRRKHQRGL